QQAVTPRIAHEVERRKRRVAGIDAYRLESHENEYRPKEVETECRRRERGERKARAHACGAERDGEMSDEHGRESSALSIAICRAFRRIRDTRVRYARRPVRRVAGRLQSTLPATRPPCMMPAAFRKATVARPRAALPKLTPDSRVLRSPKV